MEDKNIKCDILLYVAVIFILMYAFIGRTNFSFNWNPIYGIPLRIETVCRVIIYFYAIYNVIHEEKHETKVLYSCLIILGFINSNVLMVLWVALAGRSMKRCLSLGVGVYITMFGVTMIAACVGVIGKGTHGAWDGIYLGMETEGQFGFVLLFLMLQIAVLRQGRFKYYEYVAMCIIIFLNAYFYVKRNPNICMTIFVLMHIGRELYLHLREGQAENRGISVVRKYIFDYSFIWAFVIFTICVFSRNYIRLLQPKLVWLKSFLLRLDDTAEIWRAFPPTLLGRNIRTYSGRNATTLVFDPQFSSTLLFDGIIVLVVMMLISTFFMVKARQKGDDTIYIAFMVMALFSISDPAAWDISLNFLIALPFAEWDIEIQNTDVTRQRNIEVDDKLILKQRALVGRSKKGKHEA